MKTAKTANFDAYRRFAVITWEDTILWESNDLSECCRIFDIWSGFVKGIYDYQNSVYLDNVDIIDILGVQIHSED